MGDADLFAKLNRILETQNLSNSNNDDEDNDDFLERFSYDIGIGNTLNSSKNNDLNIGTPGRPTPYEVWKSKQIDTSKKKPNSKLSAQEWDGLVSHLHKTNKLKESSVMREQNEGLAAEFSGHQFRPKMNKKSQELMTAKREPLHTRCGSIITEQEEQLARKREEKVKKEVEDCTFKPNRKGASISDKYLKKLGRSTETKGTIDPEYFFKYHEEKLRRNAIRQQIVSEMTSRELTFVPTINSKSQIITEKLKKAQLHTENVLSKTISNNNTPNKSKLNISSLNNNNNNNINNNLINTPNKISNNFPFSSLTKQSTQKILDLPNKLLSETGLGDPTAGDYFGVPIIVESTHPYKNNANEYTIVHINGAISYSIVFDELTKTEPIHDYVKFYSDDRHTEYYGCGKYSGGIRIQANPKYATKDEEENPKYTTSNWCGLGGRPPLIIPASRFVVCFRTNGSINDWGFKLYATPLISGKISTTMKEENSGRPSISNRGKLFGGSNRGSFSVNDSFHDVTVSNNLNDNNNLDNNNNNNNVFHRLHKEAVVRSTILHNQQAELVQNKLKISIKPWEATRTVDENGHVISSLHSWTQNKTHIAKGGHNTDITPLLLKTKENELNNSTTTITNNNEYCIMEYEDMVNSLWKSLRIAQPHPNFITNNNDTDTLNHEDKNNNENNFNNFNNMPEL